jgi:tetratricopeptide (TPR) repeat protein
MMMRDRLAAPSAATWVVAAAFLLAAGCSSAGKQQANQPAAANAPAAAAPDGAAPASSPPALGDLNKVGKVNFPTSCDGKVQAEFERGVALLHSFFYSEARSIFESVTRQDPKCAVGYWGIAMTYYHPLWAPPTPEDMEAGRKAVEQARQASAKSELEQVLIASIAAFYEVSDEAAAAGGKDAVVGQSCHGLGSHPARAKAFAGVLEKAHAKMPADEEITAFYALALLGSATPGDPELKNQRQAAELLEKLWAVRKDHPGVVHYLIHAYDFPPLAEKGLPAAKLYASIAPRVPHALHMPSHIFIRLGMWQEAIESNIASADAAHAYAAQKTPGATSFEELHAWDYLAYAYLQTGQESKAQEIVKRAAGVKKTFPPDDMAAAYAMGAIPARFAIERHAWKEAAALTVPEMEFWAKFPFAEAHIEYARGLGRAHTGDIEGARKSLARLAELRDATKDAKFAYFKNHLELQHQAVAAWVAHAEGKKALAVKLMTKAAAMEDKLGKHPVSPGPVYPIREQLGELLVDMGRPVDALAAFQASLKISPHRFFGLYGAAHAAQLCKKEDKAREYYSNLVSMCNGGNEEGHGAELAEAKSFLAQSGGGAAK